MDLLQPTLEAVRGSVNSLVVSRLSIAVRDAAINKTDGAESILEDLDRIKRQCILVRSRMKIIDSEYKIKVEGSQSNELEVSSVPPADAHKYISEKLWIQNFRLSSATLARIFVEELLVRATTTTAGTATTNDSSFFQEFLNSQSTTLMNFVTVDNAIQSLRDRADEVVSTFTCTERVDLDSGILIIVCEYFNVVKFVIKFAPYLEKKKCESIVALSSNELSEEGSSRYELFRNVTQEIDQVRSRRSSGDPVATFVAICSLAKYQYLFHNGGLDRNKKRGHMEEGETQGENATFKA
jgi:hypothetical protein